ncbi:RNA-directed DNA polymerase (Reverse transcriptase) [Pseudomonas syringae pv. japonica str. M301072]|uniref:RNA-directed DNA polymerase n=1 Tax=Pseudomonas syringae pv. japonica str. M301072 TaxID=629262 RepID=F3FHA2_PSESX|nr:RNA-directed DNA polymerase (Reverse transcriptase) [Pseudomonas syringae pv. japonica str. M301072]
MKKLSEWKQFFLSRGLSQELIQRYLDQIKMLAGSGSPVIFELEHLSLLVGIDSKTVLAMVHGSSSFYRAFTIKKRSGGERIINAPYPSLLQCQNWIYTNILLNCPVHDNAHGYVRGRSIFTNASPHLNCAVLLKMDLKDFFPSIGINWVINFFSDLGYSKVVAQLLAALCCNRGALVQGASTSPYLTNILLRRLDERFSRLAQKNNLNYTRYADDMTFSGGYISKNLPQLISSITLDYGLTVNDAKTRLMINKNKKIVTGLSVAGTSLKITRDLKRTIKQDVFYIERYGFLSHVSQQKITDPFYLDSIFGKVNFWLQTEPGNAEAIRCRDIYHPNFGISRL